MTPATATVESFQLRLEERNGALLLVVEIPRQASALRLIQGTVSAASIAAMRALLDVAEAAVGAPVADESVQGSLL